MTSTSAHPGRTGERRQLTAFFSDLVGSTELSSRLDAEDYWEVLRAYHEEAAGAIARHGGHVAQYQGDGLLAYFGYPRAHEDAAERAVRAGLATVEAIEDLNQQLERDYSVQLSVRVGIHTGQAVLGETGGQGQHEMVALGETVNIAARIQEVAGAGEVVISEDVERLVYGRFVTHDLGPQQLKGLTRAVSALRVTAATGVRSRLDLVGEGGLTPFIGRKDELAALLDQWKSARNGKGRAAIVSGEPGIGKSRIVRALREQLGESAVWVEAQCAPGSEGTAFFPVIDLQRRDLGLRDSESPEDKLARIEAALAAAGLEVEETLPLIAGLHAIPLPEARRAAPQSSEAERRKTLEALCDWTLRLARDRPVVLVVEDLHWVDPSTLELCELLLGRLAGHSLLLVVTLRSNFEPPATLKEAAEEIRLDRFGTDEACQLVSEVAPEGSLPPGWSEEVASRGEGVPLYLEEVARSALESASRQTATRAAPDRDQPYALDIPATLRDSLMSRLDQLGPAKELAQLCSAIGREFSHGLIAAVCELEADVLRTRLDRLVQSELLFQLGASGDTRYRFRHALIQDEAHQSLLRRDRQRYHTRIGEALETHSPDEISARPELAANHFLAGGNGEKGVFYLILAARQAVTASANVEALRHADRALQLLEAWPVGPQRSQFELALETLKGSALIATRGYAADEVEEAFAHARELATDVGESPRIVPVLHGLWLFHMVRGDREPTRTLAAQLRRLGDSSDDETTRLFGLTVAGIQAYFEGRFESAVDYVDRAFSLYVPERHAQLLATYSLGTAGVARANASGCLWFLGQPDTALMRCVEVIEWARRERHPFTLCGVLCMGSMVPGLRADWDEMLRLGEEAHRIATQQGFPLWLGSSLICMGNSRAALGDDEGIDLMKEGIRVFRNTGAQTNIHFVLGGLTERYLERGRWKEADAAVDEALGLLETNIDSFYAAELHRLKGEVTLAQDGDEVLARSYFERALMMAGAEKARGLELRAALSLVRLDLRSGDASKALDRLASVFATFTEGLDTQDLIEARRILEE